LKKLKEDVQCTNFLGGADLLSKVLYSKKVVIQSLTTKSIGKKEYLDGGIPQQTKKKPVGGIKVEEEPLPPQRLLGRAYWNLCTLSKKGETGEGKTIERRPINLKNPA